MCCRCKQVGLDGALNCITVAAALVVIVAAIAAAIVSWCGSSLPGFCKVFGNGVDAIVFDDVSSLSDTLEFGQCLECQALFGGKKRKRAITTWSTSRIQVAEFAQLFRPLSLTHTRT